MIGSFKEQKEVVLHISEPAYELLFISNSIYCHTVVVSP